MHIHHQLLKRNLSQKTTVLIIYLATSLFAAASIVYVLKDAKLGYILYGILLFCVLIFAFKTDVIYSHHSEEQEEISCTPKKKNSVSKKKK